ncbi:branched-chain amino acid transport system II carrier protein [Hathewaya limosa]|uniref:Branched-chain amino acid transport system carrier protein n=1 Tax=Hathewaya limosa TaxID=1536 RepID=A0ABU0JNK2_HATLI|nr:branched-chain amino acid transport system II carrier protein [Hathewaya limosa]MDQ0478634.1 LIVCS family branched-chain amino acid:cation transporter [Hathewaya limosa]
MKKSLKFSEILSIGLLLFAIFFGAGNMIFPPLLGQLAGTNMWTAIIGFIIADVGLSLITILAIALNGESFHEISTKVSTKFASIFGIIVYLAIGPLCVIPRTGAVSYEMSLLPLVPQGMNSWIFGIIFTAIFFIITYFLALNPSKLVDRIGKIITPLLLLMIGFIAIKAILSPIGSFGAPVGDYNTIPFFKGFVEGYQTLDVVGALVISIVVINAVKQYDITSPKDIAKNTIISGIIASIALMLVYFSLGYIGASSVSLGRINDGGQLLVKVMSCMFGKSGILLLGLIITFACLTTSIGLASSFSDYFSKLYPKLNYKNILRIVCIFSFIIANLGLNTILKFSQPLLMILYPVTIVLIFVSFFDKFIKSNCNVYIGSITAALLISVIQVLDTLGLSLGLITNIIKMIPLYSFGIGWIIPSIIGGFIGFFIPSIKK